MRLDMPEKIRLSREGNSTHITYEWFIIPMFYVVLIKMTGTTEVLVTNITSVSQKKHNEYLNNLLQVLGESDINSSHLYLLGGGCDFL